MWRSWTTDECHYQYSASNFSKRFGGDPEKVLKDYIDRGTEASKVAKETLHHEEGIPTGLSDKCKIDIFYPSDNNKATDRPVFVFIHGGWWHEGDRSWSSWMASSLTSSGASVVVVGYELAPHVNMAQMVQQITQSCIYIMHWAKRNNASGIYLCGHSAGAHLAATMCSVPWVQRYMVSPAIIKGVILIGGIYDLEPFLNTHYNDTVKLTNADVLAYSPVRHVDKMFTHCPMWLVVGENEGQEFHRQTQEMYQALLSSEHSVKVTTVPDTDHFDLILNLSDVNFTLTKDVCSLMGCVPAGLMADLSINNSSSNNRED